MAVHIPQPRAADPDVLADTSCGDRLQDEPFVSLWTLCRQGIFY